MPMLNNTNFKQSLVSIIVPMLNSERYIQKCLDSILSQTYPYIELILIDNGSTDNTKEICQKYTTARYYECPIPGPSSARNVGLDHATGKYISFIDSDDYVDCNYIENLVKSLHQSNADMAVCGYYQEKENYKEIKHTKGKPRYYNTYQALEYLLRPDGFEGYLWNKIFKRELIGSIRFRKDLALWEDLVFVTEYVTKCHSVYYDPGPLYHYIKRKTSTVNKRFLRNYTYDHKYLTELDAAEIIKHTLPKNAHGAHLVLKNRKVESSIGIIESILRCDIVENDLVYKMQQNIREGIHDFIFKENHAYLSKKILGVTLCFTTTFARLYWTYKHDVLNQ